MNKHTILWIVTNLLTTLNLILVVFCCGDATRFNDPLWLLKYTLFTIRITTKIEMKRERFVCHTM